MGEPVDWMWRDQESFSDMFSGYWTDREPESASVADLDGEIVGYLLGCTDSRRVWNAGKLLAHHAFSARLPRAARDRRHLLTDDDRRDLRRDPSPPPATDLLRQALARPPPHRPHARLPGTPRRYEAGERLARHPASSGSARVSSPDNVGERERAIAFFQKIGFEKRGAPEGAPGFRTRTGERMSVQLMVMSFG